MRIKDLRFSAMLVVVMVLLGERAWAQDGEAGVPLSVCGSASGVYNDNLNFVGACGINPAAMGYFPASMSLGAFSGGKRCGECFRLTGNMGTSVVVMTYDVCNSGEECLQNDAFHFIIPTDAYKLIVNNSQDKIFSLGYQEVACEFGTTNIHAEFGGGQTGVADYQYYFTVMFTNYTVGIERVQVKGASMPWFQDMDLNQGGKWTWNKKDTPGQDQKLEFPAAIVLTGFDGEVINYQLPLKPKASVPLDTKHQFTPEQHPNVNNETCRMGLVPEYIYRDKFTYGWSVYFSWQVNTISTNVTPPANAPDLNEFVIQLNCSQQCGVNMKRPGGFETQYLKALKFSALANPAPGSLKVYFGQVGNYTVPLTNSWQNYTVYMSDIAHSPIEDTLQFVSSQNSGAVQIYQFDNIRWEYTSDAPEIPTVVVDTTTDFPTMRPLTSSGAATASATSGVSTGATSLSSQITTDESTNNIVGSNSQSKENSSSNTIPIPTLFMLLSILIFIKTFLYI